MASFPPLSLVSTTDWGPSPDVLPAHLKDVPYASFRKTDRIGRCADFASRWQPRQWNRHGHQDRKNDAFDFEVDKAEEKSFAVVDTRTEKKKTGFRPMGRPRFFHRRKQEEDEKVAAAKKKGHGSSFNKRYQRLNRARWQGRRNRTAEVVHAPSVSVQADWRLLNQYELAKLKQVQIAVPEAVDLKWCGRLDKYNDAYDRATVRSSKPLGKFSDRVFYYEGAMDDPVVQDMAEEGVGNVYATDAVLAHLMTAFAHVTPWDLVATFAQDTIFIDARKPREFEQHSVNESAHTPPESSTDAGAVNSKEALATEATVINAAFSQQVLARGSATKAATAGGDGATALGVKMEPSPFADEEEGPAPTLASLAYRYRKYDLGGGFTLVSRATVNAVGTKSGAPRVLNVYALNEFDPKKQAATPWRSLLDRQPGQVISAEMKNNHSKVSVWATRSLLAGAQEMKVGFVSRTSMRSPAAHTVLSVKTFNPLELAKQLSLSPANSFGIIRWLATLVRDTAKEMQGDTPDDEFVAKFVVLKEPNAPLLSVYSVPPESFEEEDDEDGETKGAAAGAGAVATEDAEASAWGV